MKTNFNPWTIAAGWFENELMNLKPRDFEDDCETTHEAEQIYYCLESALIFLQTQSDQHDKQPENQK